MTVSAQERTLLKESDNHYFLRYCKHDPATDNIVISMQPLLYYIVYTIPIEFVLPLISTDESSKE